MTDHQPDSPPPRKGGAPKGVTPQRIPPERYQAARAVYESTPGMTWPKLAKQFGIAERALTKRARLDGGWKKNEIYQPNRMDEVAQAVADKYAGKLADYGPEATPEQKEEARNAVAIDHAIDLRAQLIERHRREWSAPRKLVYEAMQKRDFELAKLAKITAEQLMIVQTGERKAWGIDKPSDGAPSVTVVIERG